MDATGSQLAALELTDSPDEAKTVSGDGADSVLIAPLVRIDGRLGLFTESAGIYLDL